MTDLHYVLEIEPLDLGADVKAVGLDLMEVESREPAHGSDAARIWAAALAALAGTDPWALDFFSHLDRVREYCALHAIVFEEKSSGHSLVIPALSPEPLAELFERFAGEIFGARAGTPRQANLIPWTQEAVVAEYDLGGEHAAATNDQVEKRHGVNYRDRCCKTRAKQAKARDNPARPHPR